MTIDKEDYAEPNCVLCEPPYGAAPQRKPVPQQRILDKVDEYMSRRDYAGVERHLLYWLSEARLGHDPKGELLIENELVGHYRKVQDREQALLHAEAALQLVDAIGFDGSISAGTTYVNVATAFSAFGDQTRAIDAFRRARAVYESIPSVKPELLGGLYNNMALTLVALKQFPEAYTLYEKALRTMADAGHGALEQAITYLNIADAKEAELGAEDAAAQVDGFLDAAQALLDSPSLVRDGYYAFVCEKCAPTFSYYGWFAAADELNERAKAIYERA